MAANWQVGYYRYRRYFTDLGKFYQSKKVKTYAGFIFSIIAITFFLVFAIRPTINTIGGLVRQINDQRLVTEKFQEKINSLSQAQREYGLVEKDLYLVDQALPENPQISILIKELEVLARRSKIKIAGVKFSQIDITQTQLGNKNQTSPTKTESSQSTRFSLTASGNYQQLKEFLRSLSYLRRIVIIESFGFQKSPTENETLNLSLEAEAYYLKN